MNFRFNIFWSQLGYCESIQLNLALRTYDNECAIGILSPVLTSKAVNRIKYRQDMMYTYYERQTAVSSTILYLVYMCSLAYGTYAGCTGRQVKNGL